MPRLQPRDHDKRPSASWANGKELIGTDRVWRGWFVDFDADAALDEACRAAGWEVADMAHLDGEIRSHWLIPVPAPLFVLIQGVPFTSMTAMVKNDVAYSGLSAAWPKDGRSSLGFLALHPDLIAANYLEPLPFRVKSTATDDLLTALLAHNTALDACEAASAAAGTNRTFEFYDVALPLGAGPKAARGKELQSPVNPIQCLHPAAPDVPYLRRMLAPKVVASVVFERWSEIVAWAAGPIDQGGQN
jgi:hypothetical protein